VIHFRGVPHHFNDPPAPLCDLRGKGETTTELHRVDCPVCRRILKLDGRQWGAPKPDPKLAPASREFVDTDDSEERYP